MTLIHATKKAWSLLSDFEQLEIRWIFYQQNRYKNKLKAQPKMTASRFESLLRNDLGIQSGDTVCIHSALGFLHVDLKPDQILNLLLQIVGPTGTLVFPTYPGASLEFLRAQLVFDVRKTSSASSTGVLTDLAWKHPTALRSLHPTKSMAAIGPRAHELTHEHHLSPFPYDRTSPYYKLAPLKAKIIGLGVWTYNLSFVHCIEDTMKEQFPFCPHDPRLFLAPCIDRAGRSITVATFAHDLKRISYDTLHVQDYMRKYVAKEVAADKTIEGRRFFTVNAEGLYKRMVELAQDQITIFTRGQRRADPLHERETWLQLKAKGAM